MAETALPLAGVRIVELGMVFVLPYAITPLAALGAEVIKVESAVRPDQTRWGPQPDNRVRAVSYNHAGNYEFLNRNKLGITLDLTKAEGKDLLRRLVAVSDVVAENFTPRVMRNLGLEYADLTSVNPRLILLSSSGYGHSGPWQHYRAYGPNTEAVDGLMHLTGYPDGPPTRAGAGGLGVAFTDAAGAYFGAYALLAALDYRDRHGRGLWLDLSHYEAGAATIPEALLDYAFNGREQSRQGNRHPTIAPHGCYPCRAGEWLTIVAGSDAEFAILCRLMEQPELARDARYADVVSRHRSQDQLDAIIAAWTAQHDVRALMARLQGAGIAAGMVASSQDIWDDPHLRHRDFFESLPPPEDDPVVGPRPHLRPAWRMTRTPARTRKPAPCFGEDTDAVLCSLLGLTPATIASLYAAGVLACEPATNTVARPGTLPLEEHRKAGRIRMGKE